MAAKVSTARTKSTPRRDADGLNPTERAFVNAYMANGGNATAAYRIANNGQCKDSTAQTEGHHMLHRPHVKAWIEVLVAKATAKLEITAERVLSELAAIAFADPTDAVIFGPEGITLKSGTILPAQVRATIAEVAELQGGGQRVKFHDKLAALDKLGRHLKLFTDKVEITGRLTLNDLVLGSMQPEKAAEEPKE